MTLAGAKKCAPATSCGRFVTFAMMSVSIAEELVSSSAPGFITASSFANTSFFTSMRSNTASMTTSQSRDVLVALDRLDARQPLVHLAPA